jgi:hypothetical protein
MPLRTLPISASECGSDGEMRDRLNHPQHVQDSARCAKEKLATDEAASDFRRIGQAPLREV